MAVNDEEGSSAGVHVSADGWTVVPREYGRVVVVHAAGGITVGEAEMPAEAWAAGRCVRFAAGSSDGRRVVVGCAGGQLVPIRLRREGDAGSAGPSTPARAAPSSPWKEAAPGPCTQDVPPRSAKAC